MLLDYSGSENGKLTSVDESSYFEFTEPLYAHIDEPKPTDNVTSDNTLLSDAFSGTITALRPVILYSGYYTYNQWNDGCLNTSPDNDGDANKKWHTLAYKDVFDIPLSAARRPPLSLQTAGMVQR